MPPWACPSLLPNNANGRILLSLTISLVPDQTPATKTRRAWAVIDKNGDVLLNSIADEREDAMASVLVAYMCSNPIEKVRAQAEAEMQEVGWQCVEILIEVTPEPRSNLGPDASAEIVR